jgi:hypothetical protein
LHSYLHTLTYQLHYPQFPSQQNNQTLQNKQNLGHNIKFQASKTQQKVQKNLYKILPTKQQKRIICQRKFEAIKTIRQTMLGNWCELEFQNKIKLFL